MRTTPRQGTRRAITPPRSALPNPPATRQKRWATCAILLLSLTLFASSPPAHAATRPTTSFDTSWQHAGSTWTFLGAQQPFDASGRTPETPDRWMSDQTRILDVTPSTLTIQFTACTTPANQVRDLTVTYSRQTRLDETGHGAYVWISPAEVARGVARLGDHDYVLLASSPLLFEFSDGHADYWYDAHTGVLDHVTDEWSGAAAMQTPATAFCPPSWVHAGAD